MRFKVSLAGQEELPEESAGNAAKLTFPVILGMILFSAKMDYVTALFMLFAALPMDL